MFENSPILRWKKQRQNYLLEGNKCKECKKVFYPKNFLCKCKSKSFEPIILSGKGTLLSFTKITVPPQVLKYYDSYVIGLIKLEEGPQITSQIVDVEFEDLKSGMYVKPAFRKLYPAGSKGIINYGIKFTLA